MVDSKEWNQLVRRIKWLRRLRKCIKEQCYCQYSRGLHEGVMIDGIDDGPIEGPYRIEGYKKFKRNKRKKLSHHFPLTMTRLTRKGSGTDSITKETKATRDSTRPQDKSKNLACDVPLRFIPLRVGHPITDEGNTFKPT